MRTLQLTLFLLLVCASGLKAQDVHAPPKWTNPFYKKELDAGGILIRSSAKVNDTALVEAGKIVRRMLKRDDIRLNMVQGHATVSIIAKDGEVTSSIPEHADLKWQKTFDGRPFDSGTRGVGGTEQIPVTSVGEENVLKLQGDPYMGEDILIHEFGHAVLNIFYDQPRRVFCRGHAGVFRRGQPEEYERDRDARAAAG